MCDAFDAATHMKASIVNMETINGHNLSFSHYGTANCLSITFIFYYVHHLSWEHCFSGNQSSCADVCLLRLHTAALLLPALTQV